MGGARWFTFNGLEYIFLHELYSSVQDEEEPLDFLLTKDYSFMLARNLSGLILISKIFASDQTGFASGTSTNFGSVGLR
ncbi:hypothetical protein EDD11_004056 [Mortierella claussenii]|nr:hypothetical protein EDD11_004056 [Mortierella claussenii]